MLWETIAKRPGQHAFAKYFMRALQDKEYICLSTESFNLLAGVILYLATNASTFEVPCCLLRVLMILYSTDAAGQPRYLHVC